MKNGIIKELIDFAKVGQEKADKDAETKNINGLYYLGKASAFSDIILKAELLFGTELSNDIQPQIHKTACYTPLVEFKKRRMKLDMSLRDVTKVTGVSAATISRIEQGKEAEYNNVMKLDSYYATNGV